MDRLEIDLGGRIVKAWGMTWCEGEGGVPDCAQASGLDNWVDGGSSCGWRLAEKQVWRCLGHPPEAEPKTEVLFGK